MYLHGRYIVVLMVLQPSFSLFQSGYLFPYYREWRTMKRDYLTEYYNYYQKEYHYNARPFHRPEGILFF